MGLMGVHRLIIRVVISSPFNTWVVCDVHVTVYTARSRVGFPLSLPPCHLRNAFQEWDRRLRHFSFTPPSPLPLPFASLTCTTSSSSFLLLNLLNCTYLHHTQQLSLRRTHGNAENISRLRLQEAVVVAVRSRQSKRFLIVFNRVFERDTYALMGC